MLYYPAGYEKGKTYPTVFIIYEDFFDDTLDAGNTSSPPRATWS